MEIDLVWMFPHRMDSLATFVAVTLELECIKCATYILNTTNITLKKVNQAFAIIIKTVAFL